MTLAWDASSDPSVDGYRVYWGVGPRQYTNTITVGKVLTTTVTLPARGTQFYFSATALAGGLESDFCNEVTYTPKSQPSKPGSMLPPVTLIVQSKPTVEMEWADTTMEWSIDPAEGPTSFYRLRITDATAEPQESADSPPSREQTQALALDALHKAMGRT